MRSEATGQDAATAQRVVEACYDDVLAYCRRHAPHGVDAHDIAQDAFLRFVRQNRYVDEGKPLAYLLTIAHNLCIDATRTQARAPLSLDAYTARDAAGARSANAYQRDSGDARPRSLDVPDPRDELADAELALVLDELDPEAQEIIELRFDQGLGINDIARVLNMSRFAVRRRLTRALKALEQELLGSVSPSERRPQ